MDPIANAYYEQLIQAREQAHQQATNILPETWGFFSHLHDFIMSRIDSGIDQVVSVVLSDIAPTLKILLILAVALAGLNVARGAGSAGSIQDMLSTLTRAAIVVMVISSMGQFQTWVINPLTELGATLSNAFVGPLGMKFEGAGTFDKLMGQSWLAALTVYKNLPGLNLKSVVLSLLDALFLVTALIAVTLSFGVWMVAVLLGKILLAIGPIACCCAMFRMARHIFTNWLGVMVGVQLTQALVILCVSLIAQGSADAVTAVLNEGNVVNEASSLIVMGSYGAATLLLAVLVVKIPDIAAAICNGFAVGLQPFIAGGAAYAAGAMAAGRGAAAGARAIGNLAGGGGGGGASSHGAMTPFAGRNLSGRI